MQQQAPPDMAQMAAQMATNQAKVAWYIETLNASIDQLVTAAVREDWSEVQRVSGQMADGGRESGHRAISALAQRVCDEAHRPDNAVGVKRSLIRLIGTCGRAKSPEPAAH